VEPVSLDTYRLHLHCVPAILSNRCGAVAVGRSNRAGLLLSLFLLSVGLSVRLAAAVPQTEEVLERIEEARNLRSNGEAQKALAAYNAVLPDLRKTESVALLARVLLETGQAAISAGDYPRAIEAANESAGAARLLHDLKTEGSAFNQLGTAHLYQADYADALTDFRRAFELAEIDGDAEAASTRSGNIGNVHFFQGRYLDALHSYELALEKSATISAASNGRQLALSNLAILYEQLGQFEKALEYYHQAQSAHSALLPHEYAQLLSNMGTLYRRMGDPVKALETYRAARQVFARDPHSDGEIHVLHNTGIVLALDYQAPGRALAVFTEAMKLAESTANRRQALLGRLFRGEALLRMGRFPEARGEFNLALAEAKNVGAAEEQWTAQFGIGQTYGRAGEPRLALEAYGAAIAIIEKLRGGLGASSLKVEFLGNKRGVYDAYISCLLETGHPDSEHLFELFEKARSRNLQDSLQNKPVRATIQTIQARLDGDSMLIEYWLGADRMAALWVTRDHSGVAQRNLDTGDLERLAAFARGFEGRERSSWTSGASAVAHLLFAGLPLETPRRNLLIVPDGLLYSLPFDVLPVGNSGKMAVENFAISYLPAAALLLGADKSSRVMPWRRQLMGFGDPLPPQKDEVSANERWSRLPASAREVSSAAREISGRTELHVGADNLKRYLAGGSTVPILHFSTHAAVDLLDPNRSRILFTAEKENSGSKYLFLQEAQQLSLTGVDLVILAACETEGGKLVPGEGIQSFSRAFLAAGARSTVTTLWPVADGPTADFMRLFYRELGHGVNKAEALRQAKLAFLHSGTELANPLFWAGFVLTGNGQRPVPLWGWSILTGPAALLAVCLVWGIYRRRGRSISRQSHRKDYAIRGISE
jgi:CHAT domain-containing protein/tetratricopeptide (TPR) repeat protein